MDKKTIIEEVWRMDKMNTLEKLKYIRQREKDLLSSVISDLERDIEFHKLDIARDLNSEINKNAPEKLEFLD
jgi:hypothetical protein